MKRILVFSTAYLPLIGGAELAIKELTDRLPEYEFDLLCARIKPGLPKEETLGRVRVHRLGFGRAVDKWLLPISGWMKAEALHKASSYDAIWVMMASFAAAPAEMFKRRHPDVPMLLTLQEGDTPEYIADKTRFFRGWFRNVFRRADALQTISRFLLEWGKEQGFSGEISEVIPNGVDLARFSKTLSQEERDGVRTRYGFTKEDFVIITASRLVKKNGVDLLIKAVAELPKNAKLLVVGSGELEWELRNLAHTCGAADRVKFAGTIAHDRLPATLASADAFCRPSRSEGLGSAFIEAMAAGLPVVATHVGGIPDIIQDGRNGLMAGPEDASSVSAALKRLMDDSALRTGLASAGREDAKSYDWQAIAARMRALFTRLATNR